MEPSRPDYTKLILTSQEQELFDRFKESDTATLTPEEYHILRKRNLILSEMSGNSPFFSDDLQSGVCKLSQIGKEFRAYQKKLDEAEHIARIRHWVPVAISAVALIIAIASLIVSIISLRYQL